MPGSPSEPRLDIAEPEKGYHGLVKENETLVEIILKKDGEAELRARKALNCEKRKSYKFDIAAVSCSGRQSKK
ncbi:unnamed protein product [Bemisia tabaci]|uniref:Uncharacterized protein n=1 Tax=Bemisia tabaci TaxID=7038 RepID=A0A9P0A836_BEMTA|nr:unnamed protein product [Bemisia tabaci]